MPKNNVFKKTFFVLFFTLSFFLLFIDNCQCSSYYYDYAFGGYGRTAGILLSQPLSSPILGAGETYQVIKYPDGMISLYNPAFLSQLKEGRHLTVSYRKGLADDGFGIINFSEKSRDEDGKFGVSAGFAYYNAGTSEIYDLDGNLRKFNTQRDYLLIAGFGEIDGKGEGGGFSLKFLASTLAEEYTAYAFGGLDIGGLYGLGQDSNFYFDYSLQNLFSTKMKYKNVSEEIPLVSRFGLAHRKSLGKNYMSLGINVAFPEFTSRVELCLGAEYMHKDIFAFRIGKSPRGIFMGIGYRINSVIVDYSVGLYNAIDSTTHNISLTYKFNLPTSEFYEENDKNTEQKKTLIKR